MVRGGKEKQEDGEQERDQQLWILTTSCRANHEGVSFLPRRGHKNRNGPIGKESVGKVLLWASGFPRILIQLAPGTC